MRISIGERTKEAMAILGIEGYPFSVDELSTNFRSLIKVYHPDKNPSKESENKAKSLISAYKHLKNLTVNTFVLDSDKERVRKVFEEDEDIFTIWDKCPDCKGSGVVKNLWPLRTIEPCPDCDPLMDQDLLTGIRRSSGIKTLKCKYCKNGKFTQRHGKVVECRVCFGTGIWKKVRCRTCRGSGLVRKKVTNSFITCPTCQGLGRIKINPFNPVIRKGSVL